MRETDRVRKCPRGEPDERTISTSLDRALSNLPELLASFVVDRRPHAVIVQDERYRYVQVLPLELEGIIVECVSNQFLPPRDHHDARAHQALVAIGFSPPNTAEGRPNWSWVSDSEPNVLRASRMAGAALSTVLGLSRRNGVTVLDRHVHFVSSDADQADRD